MKIDHRFSFFIFLKKLKFDTDFLFSFFYVQKKIKIEHRFSFVIFHFSISKKIKIEHRFPFFIFLCLEKNENWKSIVDFYFSFLIKKKKKKKIEHRFSFFIFQLAEEMNDPNIHAFSPIWYTWNVPCIFALRSYMFKNWCF